MTYLQSLWNKQTNLPHLSGLRGERGDAASGFFYSVLAEVIHQLMYSFINSFILVLGMTSLQSGQRITWVMRQREWGLTCVNGNKKWRRSNPRYVTSGRWPVHTEYVGWRLFFNISLESTGFWACIKVDIELYYSFSHRSMIRAFRSYKLLYISV